MKRLLITSDDFGMTLSVNRGIESAMEAGLVRSTNLMVPCPWFMDAVARVKEKNLPSGIHLTLTCEWDRYRWRPLTDSMSLRAEDGGMHREYVDFPQKLQDEEIFAEYGAQLVELRRLGIRPTHVDTHMIASSSSRPIDLRIKSIVERFCRVEGLLYTYSTEPDGGLKHFDSEIQASPLSTEELELRLRNLADGTHHMIAHCAVDGDELGRLCVEPSEASPWAREYRVKDHDSLTGTALPRLLHDLQFELVDIHEVIRNR